MIRISVQPLFAIAAGGAPDLGSRPEIEVCPIVLRDVTDLHTHFPEANRLSALADARG